MYVNSSEIKISGFADALVYSPTLKLLEALS